jgi:ubiquinone/menaquinone biosynthesis C-methylase UbiE
VPAVLPNEEAARRVAAHYSAEAEAFAGYWAPILRQMSVALIAHLPLPSAERVVEIGVGTGGLVADVRDAAPRATIVGADISEGMLAVARRQSEARLVVSDAQRLALRSGSVDVALFAFVLHRVPEPGAALREAARVLRPGGVAGIVAWGAVGRSGAAARIWHEEVGALGAPAAEPMTAQHAVLDAPEKLGRLLRVSGFTEARAWRRTFDRDYTRDEWLTFQLGYADRRRLAGIDPERRRTLERRVRARVQSLPIEEFSYQSEAVFGLGYTPARPS